MKNRPVLRCLATAVALVSLAAACGRGDGDTGSGSYPDPGITDGEIVVGANAPLTGPGSGFANVVYGASAFFGHLNETEGGVTMADGKKRKVRYIYYDDGYQPAKTVEVVKRLVEKDKVFALAGGFGTATNLAVRDYLNQKGVPQVFIQSNSPKWGAEFKKYPFSLSGSPSAATEAAVFAQYVQRERPKAKVAILTLGDDNGAGFLNGFKEALKGTDMTIVSEQTYANTDASIDSQMSIMASSGADVFANFATPKFTALAIKGAAELGWKPLQLVASQGSSPEAVLKPAGLENAKDIVTVGWFKDPTDPQWAADETMSTLQRSVQKYEPRANPKDSFAVAGWALAEVFTNVLKDVDPTRSSLMDAVHGLNGQTSSALLPKLESRTSPTDGFPLETLWLQRFDGGKYEFIGAEPISLEGRTPVGER
ncbi:ABC transporter substrate-binding protein [Streptosporangium sp. NPDC004631]